MSSASPPIDVNYDDIPYPDTSLLITEDGKPVDNLFVEKQYRLLTEPLWTSWKAPEGRPFRVLANVGLFFAYKEAPLVPDVMFALDVESPPHPRESDSRSYFVWVVGNPPDVAIEIVSDKRCREDSEKLRAYERVGVPFYVIFDPELVLGADVLRAFRREGGRYQPTDPATLGDLGLGLKLWDGEYEGGDEEWLRWISADGKLIPTGKEKAEEEQRRAEEERRRAEEAESRARLADDRIKTLEARLRNAGLSANGTR